VLTNRQTATYQLLDEKYVRIPCVYRRTRSRRRRWTMMCLRGQSRTSLCWELTLRSCVITLTLTGWCRRATLIPLNVCVHNWSVISFLYKKLKVKEGHIPKERRRGTHLPFIGRFTRRWIYHCCLWRTASATPNLRLPSQPKPVLNAPTHIRMARLSWPGWLITYRDGLPPRRRSPIQALTWPSVE